MLEQTGNDIDNKRSNIIIKYIVRVLMVIMLVVGFLLFFKLINMHIFPLKYLVLFVTLIFLICIIIMATSSKKVVAIIMSFFSLVIIVAMIFGFVAVVKLDNTLKKISSDSRLETVQMSVIVLKDNKAVNLSDVSGYKIGFNEDDSASNDMKSELENDFESNADYTGYGNVIFLIDALLDKKEEAIIINSAYIDVVSELEGYKDFADKVKILDTIPIETAMDDVNVNENNVDKSYRFSSDENSFVVYISGIDTYGNVNTRSRSDVNILAVVNVKAGKIQLINTPRDYFVPLSISNGVRDKLTHAGIYGVDVSQNTLADLYDVKIDYYLRMNFSSFEKIIDELGGIDVYSESDFSARSCTFTKGVNHLNGAEALVFARERYSFSTGDVQRGINQMEVIKALVSKLSSKDFLYNYDKVLDDISDCIQTDIPTDLIYSLVNYQLGKGTKWKVESYTVKGFNGSDTTYSMPGQFLYVMIPDEKTVEEAKGLIESTLNIK